MGETVDVLVVGKLYEAIIKSRTYNELCAGGNYGSGRRAGGVSTLICAVVDDRRHIDDEEEPKSVFH